MGSRKGQSAWPCPSVYSPTTALGSLSSVALSSAPAPVSLAQGRKQDANYYHFCAHIWSGFLGEATNPISSGFLGEAIGSEKLPQARFSSGGYCPFRMLPSKQSRSPHSLPRGRHDGNVRETVLGIRLPEEFAEKNSITEALKIVTKLLRNHRLGP
jgi:hypothetical protein